MDNSFKSGLLRCKSSQTVIESVCFRAFVPGVEEISILKNKLQQACLKSNFFHIMINLGLLSKILKFVLTCLPSKRAPLAADPGSLTWIYFLP